MKVSEVFFLYNTVKLFNMFTRAKDKYLPYLTADFFSPSVWALFSKR